MLSQTTDLQAVLQWYLPWHKSRVRFVSAFITIAILNHLRDIVYCSILGNLKYLFCRMPLTNRSLICSKQVVHNAWVRTKVLPFNQMSSTGFSWGAYGANRVQSIFHWSGGRSAWIVSRKSRMVC